MIEIPPRGEPEVFTFRGPIGTTEVSGLPGDSLCNLAFLKPEIPNITFKEALGIDMDKECRLLVSLGFNRTQPVDINGQMVAPWSILKFLQNSQSTETLKAPDIRHGGCAIVRGVKDGQKTEYRVEAWPSENLVQEHKNLNCGKYGGPGGIFRCGSPMGSVAVLMAQGKVKPKGVFLPSFSVPSDEFLKQEAAMGISVEITETVML
jgi:saccharopine dehydrogenase-like NADP-dependent oxidoreductase